MVLSMHEICHIQQPSGDARTAAAAASAAARSRSQ